MVDIGTKCLSPPSVALSWNKASEECEKKGMTLVSLTDPYEMLFFPILMRLLHRLSNFKSEKMFTGKINNKGTFF